MPEAKALSNGSAAGKPAAAAAGVAQQQTRARQPGDQQQQPDADSQQSTNGRNSAVQRLGLLWVLCGLSSYITLSLLARAALHTPAGLHQLQEQVPRYVYDRSLFVFGTACLLDVLGMLFELKSSRLDMVVLPAFVKGLATLTNGLVRSGWAAVGIGASGRLVMVQRYVCWMHTTPTILLLVKMISTSITRQQAVRAVVCVETMLLTGLAGSLTAGWWTVFWGGLSHLAFLPLLPYLHQGLKEASAVVSLHAARPTMTVVYYLTMVMWCGFGVVWDLRLLGLVDTHTEEVANLCCDFAAKVMFSAGLMLSSFKSLDSRREVVMRQIQEAHKQTLILELRRAIEQKDAFMSSVSHELRTPLNGIIGISEGLLANCCGVLSESVRRQLFIVRTSGARLLALINDVMDAATLRQHRLVLKQEKLELRQVVGDVVDLTRSLVDADVSLRNDVPEGLEVWADSGRIIQILNNLLGNAAKFTHQGSIRVSAKWHDEQRQWVSIQVTDTGIGIPKQKLQTIFLPFEQVDGSISRQYGGFGLGLSITQELVKAHGGELWVHSKVHKGSQFMFTIPSFTGQKPLTPQQQQQLQLQSRRSVAASRTQALLKAGAELQTPAAAAAAGAASGEKLQRQRSSSRGALSLPSPAAAAAAAEDGSAGPTLTRAAAAERRRRSSWLLSPSAAANPQVADLLLDAAAAAAASPSPNGTADDLLGDGYAMLGDEYDSPELPYDAAQLSALASTKPFVAHQLATAANGTSPTSSSPSTNSTRSSTDGTSSSSSSTLQRAGSQRLRHAGSMLSLAAAASLDPDGGGADAIINPLPNRDQRPSQFACTGRYQILSVDDDPVNQTVVQSLLASTGYEVVCRYNGQQTLEYIDSAEVLPDLILLDMLMPDMSGPEVLRRLAERVPPLGVPIILVSALAEESSVVQGLDSGADDYITKPFRRAEFLARIRGKLQLASTAGAAGEQAALPGPSNSGSDEPVVMCITDDEINHVVLEGILQSQSYSYQKVSSGAEALKLLEAAGNTPPHLVLLDAALPDTTGLEVLQSLRVRFSQVALPVIMMTARHNEKAIVQALDAGANDYAVKPFRRSELLARIRMHLRSSQNARAAAASPTPAPPGERHSGELSLAGDFSDQHMELQQCSLRLEQLSSVPLLVVQLGGVDDALAGATAEQACQLMGFIADCFDALVEKYAVLKVEASDTSLTVAAPISISSCHNSARNSLQLPVVQMGSSPVSSLPQQQPGGDGAAVPQQTSSSQDAAAAGGDSALATAAAAAAGASAMERAASAPQPPTVLVSRPSGALCAATLQLLQLAQELQAYLGVDAAAVSRVSSSSAGSDRPSTAAAAASAGCAAVGATGTTASTASTQATAQRSETPGARPHTPLQLLQDPAPCWWQGQLHVQMGLHVGALHGGVVGRRRPRYRLMGPALDVVRLACSAAPDNCTVATAQAAELLLASGVQSLKPLKASSAADAADAAHPQLWMLRAGSAMSGGAQLLPAALSSSAAPGAGSGAGGGVPGGITHGVLSQAAAALTAADDAAEVGKAAAAAGLMHVGSIDLTASAVDTTTTAAVAAFAPAPAAALPPQLSQCTSAAAASDAASIVVPLGLPPLQPSLVDAAALQQNQLLLLQELSLFAQQLTSGVGATTLGADVLQCDGGSQHRVSQAVAAAVSEPLSVPSTALVSGCLSLHEWNEGHNTCVTSQPQLYLSDCAAVQETAAPVEQQQQTFLAAGGGAALANSSDVQQPVSASLPWAVGDSGWCVYGGLQPQLGPSELHQISLLQQELAALQQHLDNTTFACLPPTNGGSPHGFVNGGAPLQVQTVPPILYPQQHGHQMAGGGSSISAADAAGMGPAASAAGSSGSCSSGGRANSRSSRRSSTDSIAASAGGVEAPRDGMSGQQHAAGAKPTGKGRSRGQLLGGLFRRRSSRKDGQQQPPREDDAR